MSMPQEEWALDDSFNAEADPDLAVEGADPGLEAPPEPSPVEKLAMKAGWKPEADWKGDKSTWTPAEQYLETTITKQREAADRAKDLTRQSRAQQRDYSELQSRMERFERATHQLMSEQEQRHRLEIERTFEAAKKKAAKEGDDELYDELVVEQRKAEAAVDKKFKQEPELDYTQQAQEMLTDPVVGKFLREHPWVVRDEEAYSYAFSVAQDLADAGYPKSMQIRAVKEALREEYPHYFQAKQADPAAARAIAATQNEEEDPDEGLPDFLRKTPKGEQRDERQEQRGEAVERPRDEQGRFLEAKNAHLATPQPMRRPAPQMQAGSRQSVQTRQSPEAKAWNSLPAEARSLYEQQRKSGAIKMDIVKYAKIYNGEQSDVLD